MTKPIRKAIFPVGGQGTRFLPATKVVPKEMLPVVDRPLLQYAVDEALAAGIEQFDVRHRARQIEHWKIISTSPGNWSASPDREAARPRELAALAEHPARPPARITYVRQQQPARAWPCGVVRPR